MNSLAKNVLITFQEIKRNKILFASLIVLQALFIAAFAFTFLTFQLRILESARGIIEPLQNANYDPDSIDAGQPFLNNPSAVYNSYQMMVSNIYYLIGSVFLLALIFNSLLWAGSRLLLHPPFSIKRMADDGIKFAAVFAIIAIPFLIICYLLARTIVFAEDPTSLFSLYTKIALLLAVIAYYLGLVAMTTITSPWKSIVTESWRKMKNFPKTVPVFLINTLFIAASLYLIYKTISVQSLNSYLLIATAVLIIILVITRLYWLVSLTEKHEKNNP